MAAILAKKLGMTQRFLEDGRVERVAAKNLARGDRIVVYTGERVPADGTVVDGAATVDEICEKAQVNKEQNKASKNIYHKKHNGATQGSAKTQAAAKKP